jgi:putative membrane protein
MASYYLWIKATHLIFMVTWFAGLFYLPRLFIYHVQTADDEGRARFTVMERRLFAIMTIGAVLTVIAGLLLLAIRPVLVQATWFLGKLALIAGLLIYHFRCWQWIGRLQRTNTVEDSKWLRWFNEIPVMFLFGIILLAVAKPF